MTTELEKQFFDTFEIEPIAYCEHGCNATNLSTKCKDCIYVDELKYPQITDRILLELICILNRHFNATGEYPIMLLGLGYEPLKEHILKRCIHNEDNIKYQVQALFKE